MQIQWLAQAIMSACHHICFWLASCLSLSLPTRAKGAWLLRIPLFSSHLPLYSSFLFDLKHEKRCCPDILPNNNVAFGLILILFSHFNCDYSFQKQLKVIMKLIHNCANVQKKIFQRLI